MTAAQFKQCAKNYGIKVYSARRTGEKVVVKYAHYLSNNGWPLQFYDAMSWRLSQMHTREFHGKSYAEIIDARLEH